MYYEQNNKLFENKEIQSTIKFPTLIPIILSRLSKQMAPVDQTYTCPSLCIYCIRKKNRIHTLNTECGTLFETKLKLFNGLSNSFLIIIIIIIVII